MSGSIYNTVFGSGNAAAPTGVFTNMSLANTLTMGDASNVALNTGNGSRVGTAANQKLGLWGATPIVQPAGTAELVGSVGNAATNANAVNMTSNGNTGSAAYSFNDVVKAMKKAGMLTQ